jgi:hypothetical protein
MMLTCGVAHVAGACSFLVGSMTGGPDLLLSVHGALVPFFSPAILGALIIQ